MDWHTGRAERLGKKVYSLKRRETRVLFLTAVAVLTVSNFFPEPAAAIIGAFAFLTFFAPAYYLHRRRVAQSRAARSSN